MSQSRYAQLYLDPHGPGDARPTALDIVRENKLEGTSMDSKVALVTGCSSGLGIETARALAATGITLYLTARNIPKAQEALAGLIDGPHAARIHLMQLDLNSLEGVRHFAQPFQQQSQQLNVLISNAGIRQPPAGKTTDGFEQQFGTNHLAHFLLFHLLVPTLLSSSTPVFHSRVVMVSSQAHRQFPFPTDLAELSPAPSAYNPVKAYSYSKLANVYTANEIERRFGSRGLHAWSLHPGGIRTQLNKARLTWGWVYDTVMVVTKLGIRNTQHNLMSAEQGAATTVWAAIARDLEGRGGKYLERCTEAEPVREGYTPLDPGHAPWAYDVAAAGRLWDASLEMVGLAKDGQR